MMASRSVGIGYWCFSSSPFYMWFFPARRPPIWTLRNSKSSVYDMAWLMITVWPRKRSPELKDGSEIRLGKISSGSRRQESKTVR